MKRGVVGVTVLLSTCAGCAPDPFAVAPHPAFPQVATLRGDVLSHLTLVTIVTDGDGLAAGLAAFGDHAVASAWWAAVSAEFGLDRDARHIVVHGARIAAKPLAEHEVFSYIAAALDAAKGPAPDGNTLFLLYLPPGATLSSGSGSNDMCQQVGGYHTVYGPKGDNLAVIQRCPAGGALTALDETTMIASHEIVEAASDPDAYGYRLARTQPVAPWKQSVWAIAGQYAEVGDLCQGAMIVDGDYVFQRFFAPSAAARGGDPCLPAIGAAYYNVGAAADWYAVDPATGKVDVDLTAWSTGDRAPWPITTYSGTSNTSFTTTLISPLTALNATRSMPFPASVSAGANGTVLTLHVQAPPTAVSGNYSVIAIYSLGRDEQGYALPRGSDWYHTWLVGAYRP